MVKEQGQEMLHLTAQSEPFGVSGIEASEWNRLTGTDLPFLRHEFLAALESKGCLGEAVGWIPCPLILKDAKGHLRGALPRYLKFNSFGEFVFDWSWAEAYERAGLSYYPKHVVAAPFTPATGTRLLTDPSLSSQDTGRALMAHAAEMTLDAGVSSLHWLFATDPDLTERSDFLPRWGCQFHWENQGYPDFEAFLATMTSKRRKEILRERRQVEERGLELVCLSGLEVSAKEWQTFHALYRGTFDKHGNYPALTLDFFKEIASTMGDQVLLVMARHGGEMVAAAYFLVGTDTLYGRYWGCVEEVPGLHFEACYYQGIEYAIAKGLKHFEPGAQGEHKISRGFLPTTTLSYHFIPDLRFRAAIARHLAFENQRVEAYRDALMARSPFKQAIP